MRKVAIAVALVCAVSGLAFPQRAEAQHTVRYLVGAGVSVDELAADANRYEHLFGAALVSWPSPRARGRLDALAGGPESGLTGIAGLQVDLLEGRRITPYVTSGVGFSLVDPDGLSRSFGAGIQTRAGRVPIILEIRLQSTKAGEALGVSLGTVF